MAQNVEDVTFNVTANTGQAEQALAKLRGEVDKTNASLDKKKTATDKSAASTVNASGAAISFNRIIQDAPFGIIGVANNITMLAEQFVALRVQAGGTAAALTAMKASLMGPLGLVLAISAITTAMQIWALQSQKTKKAVDVLGDSVKKLVEFKNPFENFVLKFDTQNIDKAISEVRYKLATLKTQLNTKTNPTAEDMLDASKMEKWAGQQFSAQKELKPKIAVYEKLLDYLGTVKKEIDVDSQVWKALNELLSSGIKDEKDPNPKADENAANEKTKTVKEKIEKQKEFLELFRDEVMTTLEIDDLMGKKTRKSVFEGYLEIIGQEIKNGKVSQKELLEWLRLRKLVMQEMKEDLRYNRTEGFDLYLGLDGKTMKTINKLDVKADKKAEKESLKLAKEKLAEEKKQAKEQYKIYKEFFIDPFTETFRGEFSKAWNSIFGEANSLLEKFLQKTSEALFNKAIGGIAEGIGNMIMPGLGSMVGGIFGFGKVTVNTILDGEMIATSENLVRGITANQNRMQSLGLL